MRPAALVPLALVIVLSLAACAGYIGPQTAETGATTGVGRDGFYDGGVFDMDQERNALRPNYGGER